MASGFANELMRRLEDEPAAAASLAEWDLGPERFAWLVGELDPRRAAAMLEHLSPGFLAEVAVAIDPQRMGDFAALVPADLASEVAAHLDRRDERAVLAAFVDRVTGR